MHLNKRLLLFLLATQLLSCSEKTQIKGFDSTAWQQDKFGCALARQRLQTDFNKIRRDLYGLKEQQIIDVLGRPDGEQLMARGQRIFYYYLEPGSQCKTKDKLSEANRAEVRFNALNRVSEITFAKPLAK